MTAIAAPVARFAVRMTITVVWALILSKLIRSGWTLTTKAVRGLRNKLSTKK